MRLFVKNFIAAACAFAAAGSLASGAEADQDSPTFGAWKVQCESTASCQTFLSLARADSDQVALSASFYFVKDASQPTGVVTLPLGVALKPGVRIRTESTESDEEPILLQPEVCFPDGCRVVFNLTAENLAAITKSATFAVDFFAYSQANQPGSIDVPTDGLNDALNYISIQQSDADNQ